MLTIFVRSVVLFVFAVLSMRVMGKRQVGQLQPFELVVAIMIAELAATPMGDVGIPLLYGLLPMAALIVCHGLITALCMVSERFRVWMCGQPAVLIRNGAICEKQMRKAAMTLNDLMEALRLGGALDPSEVGTAVLETGGHMTVFPKAQARPLTPEDMGLQYFEKTWDRLRRHWYVYVPSAYRKNPDKKYPAVLAIHGYSCTGKLYA